MKRVIADILKYPSARVRQRFELKIGSDQPVQPDLCAISFELNEALNETYRLDIVATSADHAIDAECCVGRRATFTIVEEGCVPSMSGLIESVIAPARVVHGVVTRWERRKTSRDETTYALRIEPRYALLGKVWDSGVFRNVSLKELITEAIVDRDLFDPHDIEFHLEGLDAKFEQTVMYEETVKAFVDRHCRRAGIYYYWKQGSKEDGAQRDTLVFGNNPRGYVRALEVPFMPDSGLSGNWHEAVLSVSTVRELVPERVELWDRNYRIPDDPLTASAIVAHDDRSIFGSVNRSIEHHHSREAGQALADARRDELIARQQTLYGTSDAIGMTPGLVVRLTNRTLAEAPYGMLITRQKTTGSLTQPVFCEFEATPAHLTWRPEYDPFKHWRWVSGVVTGVVKSRDAQPYAWLDAQGRYEVEPVFARRSGKRGKNLMSLRLLRPGASYLGGFHSPQLPETEVRLLATNGDVDRLLIAGAVHDYSHPDIVHSREGWYSRAVWRSPLGGADLRFDDMKQREGAKLATVYMKTSMSLGFLVDSAKKERGHGFEISTQGWGTLHAPKGMIVSADALSSPDAPQLEMHAALGELRAALQRVTELVKATTLAKAAPADQATQASLLNALNDLKAAGLIASAPAGIALATPKSVQHAAGENVMLAAGRHVDVSAFKRFTLAAGELISICAHRLGMSLFAAKGKLEIQAQNDALDLLANQQLLMSSTNADVLVVAKEKAVMASGGAALTIENGNIVFHCPGEFRIKAASFVYEGPQSMNLPLRQMPKSSLQMPDSYPSSL
ncbi:type VI secretion system Vgr family protein [Paraburkholderia sp. SOS3]|uniref:type VI secretion system Vgr family protein n=1 Tax=Paraburkholderia sp. SOS3 TaxID=1926494 RepID=UPI0009476F12|nr:type VI secretion system tip protein VgrG [Paraburkholderia sp. SOS3]APR35848.1 type IV secretion protein Rhs [Paraburkholderia sp. SOS3]